ncbi:CsbD-like protein [Granulicatella adiacens ATCC 49175]|jgi:UPF0337 protein spr1626|uniref:CsbD-like protein n=2 Tax=Carnobacteriaceae TaxID=186828 RepID=C8NG84_9LACT|nr:CsbD-like protein [Granulicatella adiacens ATCC 49175]
MKKLKLIMEVKTMSVEEKFNQAKGSVKEGLGKLTGDKKTEKEGAAEKVVSKVKEVAEDAKDAVEGAIEGVKNMINKDDK